MTEDECLNGRPQMGLPPRTRTGRMPVPLPTRDFGEVGPKEGERFPDVPLSDPIGRMVDLREARAGWQAIVVSTGARNGDRSARRRLSERAGTGIAHAIALMELLVRDLAIGVEHEDARIRALPTTKAR